MTYNQPVIVSIDLSSTSTGVAILAQSDGSLLDYACIKPKVSKDSPKIYPYIQLAKMLDLSNRIIEFIKDRVNEPATIVIEEVNRGKCRLTQKTLDGAHYILLKCFMDEGIDYPIHYIDSDGNLGWRGRSGLDLRLSESDKLLNKDAAKLNKKLQKGQRKIPKITKKTLACRYVNKRFGLELKENKAGGADIADAIGLGIFYIDYVLGRDKDE